MSLGRIDLSTPDVTIQSLRVEPKAGCMDRIQIICSFLLNHKFGAIRFSNVEPDLFATSDLRYDWEDSVYGTVEEVFHVVDSLGSLKKHLVTISYHNSILHHIMVASRSVSSVLYFVSKTPANL